VIYFTGYLVSVLSLPQCLSSLIEQNGIDEQLEKRYGYTDKVLQSWDQDKLESHYRVYQKRIHTMPRACWVSGGSACNRTQFVDFFHLDEIFPDALLLGESASSGGFFAAIVGGEMLIHKDGSISPFTYSGVGSGVGESVDASVPMYGGFVWNLEDPEEYEGEFWSLTVDWSVGSGVEVSLFGTPGTIPLINGGTWGVAGKPITGFGSSISFYETFYVPGAEVLQEIQQKITSIFH